MLAYDCKQCKHITVGGYVNEYNEHFCSTKCYILYCNTHGYKTDLSNLKPVKNALNN